MTSSDIKIDNLIINQLTRDQYSRLKEAGNVRQDELYFITDDSSPLEGKTYDLSQNGMFTKLVIDLARSFGATIVNSPVEGLVPASIIDGENT